MASNRWAQFSSEYCQLLGQKQRQQEAKRPPRNPGELTRLHFLDTFLEIRSKYTFCLIHLFKNSRLKNKAETKVNLWNLWQVIEKIS